MAHAVVRTDRMYGTDVDPGLVSVKYIGAASTETAIDNGNVVLLNGLMTGEREVYAGITPAANSALKDIVLIATPELMYDERLKNLDDFYNLAGGISRAYHLHTSDIFSVTAEALTAEADIAVGNIVELAASTKLNVVSSVTEGSTVVGRVIAIDVVGRYTYYAIEVA